MTPPPRAPRPIGVPTPPRPRTSIPSGLPLLPASVVASILDAAPDRAVAARALVPDAYDIAQQVIQDPTGRIDLSMRAYVYAALGAEASFPVMLTHIAQGNGETSYPARNWVDVFARTRSDTRAHDRVRRITGDLDTLPVPVVYELVQARVLGRDEILSWSTRHPLLPVDPDADPDIDPAAARARAHRQMVARSVASVLSWRYHESPTSRFGRERALPPDDLPAGTLGYLETLLDDEYHALTIPDAYAPLVALSGTGPLRPGAASLLWSAEFPMSEIGTILARGLDEEARATIANLADKRLSSGLATFNSWTALFLAEHAGLPVDRTAEMATRMHSEAALYALAISDHTDELCQVLAAEVAQRNYTLDHYSQALCTVPPVAGRRIVDRLLVGMDGIVKATLAGRLAYDLETELARRLDALEPLVAHFAWQLAPTWPGTLPGLIDTAAAAVATRL